MAKTIFMIGMVVALLPTLARHYLVWPWPGSQAVNWIRVAYVLHRCMPASQAIGLALIAVGGTAWVAVDRSASVRLTVISGVAAAAGLLYMAGRFAPVAIFLRPWRPTYRAGLSDQLPAETLVLGVVVGHEARAYPIRLLGFHHQVDDELSGEPIHVTYCSVCRSGRVFRPLIKGRRLSFDLIGTMRNNSVYEDRETRSWWVQARGEAVLGPLTGERLPELRADQMTLGNWLELHPDSLVLQPDPSASFSYRFYGFGKWDTKREKVDAAARWRWVVAVTHAGQARAYPWSLLSRERLIQDQIGDLPLAVQMHRDLISVRVWDRRAAGRVVDLRLDPLSDRLIDEASQTGFGFDGRGVGGELDGCELQLVASSVEFWHSFAYFTDGELYREAEVEDSAVNEN